MKIGYVGLDSSHADGFMTMVNVTQPQGLPEGRFTHIWGQDAERAQALKEKCCVETICPTAEAMVGQVDAVVVGARSGTRHLAEARPFLEAGLSVFIDKPLTNDLADAKALLDLATEHGARVTSFSGLRCVPEVREFKRQWLAVEAERYGGSLSGHGDDTNPYGGWYFYAVHAIELLLECWAPEAGQVLAEKIGRQLHMRFALADGQVVSILLSPKFPPFSLVAYADHKIVMGEVPLGGMQLEVTRRVLGFLHGAEDLTRRELLAPLKVMEAVRESLDGGKPAMFEV